MSNFKHFTWHQRLELYRYLYIDKLSKKEIADRLNFHISNIYREIERGMCESLNSNYNKVNMYSPEISQKRYEENRKNCGRKDKLQKNSYSLYCYEKIILKMDYSPRASIAYIKYNKNEFPYIVIISYSTIYRYIYKKKFYKLTMKNLAYYKNRAKYMQIKRQKRASAGTSIEYRDERILSREEFGHWEMDELEGSQGSKKAVLNLTERKTRRCILFIVNKKNPYDIIKCLDYLENRYGSCFYQIFKTITVDNGIEFSYAYYMEKSLYIKNKRVTIYYCHSHSPHERGSNENLNRMLRRKIKKGSNIDCISPQKLESISEWINNYPRKILNWKSSEYNFKKELSKIAI